MSVTRNTLQREIILDAVRSTCDHPTAENVYKMIQTEHPSISRATVFRNLKKLVEHGDIYKVVTSEGADHYDFRSHHYHIRCKICGRVEDVKMPYLEDFKDKIEDAAGFSVTGYNVSFDGICPHCKKKLKKNKEVSNE